MNRTFLAITLAAMLCGCQTTDTKPPVNPPPEIIVPTLPPGHPTRGILIHLRHEPNAELRSLLEKVATELTGSVWRIDVSDLNNIAEQQAVEAALRAGATLVQYVP